MPHNWKAINIAIYLCFGSWLQLNVWLRSNLWSLPAPTPLSLHKYDGLLPWMSSSVWHPHSLRHTALLTSSNPQQIYMWFNTSKSPSLSTYSLFMTLGPDKWQTRIWDRQREPRRKGMIEKFIGKRICTAAFLMISNNSVSDGNFLTTFTGPKEETWASCVHVPLNAHVILMRHLNNSRNKSN